MHKLIDLNFKDFFELEISKYHTRGHIYKLRIPKCMNGIRKNFFSIRVLPAWNFLPNELVIVPSISAFKAGLQAVDLSKFLLR